MLLGPFRVVLVGVATTAVSEGARILHHTPRRLPVFSAAVSLGLAGLAAAWGVVLLLALPQGLGDLVLGDLWQPAYPLVLPLTISLMASCFRVGAGIGLHALGAARRSMRIGLITPAAVVACSIAGALAWGLLGSVWLATAASCLCVLPYWLELRWALQEADGVDVPAWMFPHTGRQDAAQPSARSDVEA